MSIPKGKELGWVQLEIEKGLLDEQYGHYDGEFTKKDYDADTNIVPSELDMWMNHFHLGDLNNQNKDISILWNKYKAEHPDAVKRVAQAIQKAVVKHGKVTVLRKGVFVDGLHIPLVDLPSASADPEDLNSATENRVTFGREIVVSNNPEVRLDFVFAINGIVISAMEAKGESVDEAETQFRERDCSSAKAPLIFKNHGCLWYFGISPDEFVETTRLRGRRTTFKNQNKGIGEGQARRSGNPDDDPFPTAFFWKEFFTRGRVIDYIANILLYKNMKDEDGFDAKESVVIQLISPRQHQADCVYTVLHEMKMGQHVILIDHYCGSGKTYTLIMIAEKSRSMFEKIIIVTDRLTLDTQWRKVFKDSNFNTSEVAYAKNANDLQKALLSTEVKVIITTLQKFSYTQDDNFLKNKLTRILLIIDEADESTSGEYMAETKKRLNSTAEDLFYSISPKNAEEEYINKERDGTGLPENLYIVAATGTVKENTLRIFGKEIDSVPKATHTYSRRQSIEDGNIKDVLISVTVVNYSGKYELSGYKDEKVYARNENAIAKFLLREDSYKYKIYDAIIRVVEKNKLGRKNHRKFADKSIAALYSKEDVLKAYYFIKDEILNPDSDWYISDATVKEYFNPCYAFSDTIHDYAINADIKENALNGGRSADKAFHEDCNFAFVVNKLQRGYDEPKIANIFVMKHVTDAALSQLLERANRPFDGKKDVMIVLYDVSEEELKKAYKPYTNNIELTPEDLGDRLNKLANRIKGEELLTTFTNEIIPILTFASKDAQNFYYAADKLRRRTQEAFHELDQIKKCSIIQDTRSFVKLYSEYSFRNEITDTELVRYFQAFSSDAWKQVIKNELKHIKSTVKQDVNKAKDNVMLKELATEEKSFSIDYSDSFKTIKKESINKEDRKIRVPREDVQNKEITMEELLDSLNSQDPEFRNKMNAEIQRMSFIFISKESLVTMVKANTIEDSYTKIKSEIQRHFSQKVLNSPTEENINTYKKVKDNENFLNNLATFVLNGINKGIETEEQAESIESDEFDA